MSSILGNILKVSIFGESHGEAVGVTIHNLPSGLKIEDDYIYDYLKRRATGKNNLSSARKEDDNIEFLSGVYNGFTCGTPLTMIIRNNGTKSSDYEKLNGIARPSHADYSGNIRYKGFNDPRGGGHFSGRLTTPMVLAGALCANILEKMGIYIAGNIIRIGNERGERMGDSHYCKEEFAKLKEMDIPAVANAEGFKKEIIKAKNALDSVGGYIECGIIGVKSGLGSPIFDGLENRLAASLFGIPAVKGIDFGDESELFGSQYNDKFIYDGNFKTITNHDGGINGGISNGMNIVFTLKIKPTPSIYSAQKTVNFIDKTNIEVSIVGRHDPCILIRAVPCVEAVSAITVLDAVLEGKIYD